MTFDTIEYERQGAIAVIALNRPKNPLKTIPVTQHICLNCGLKEGQTLQVTAGDLVLLEGRFDVPKTNVYITRVDVRLGSSRLVLVSHSLA